MGFFSSDSTEHNTQFVDTTEQVADGGANIVGGNLNLIDSGAVAGMHNLAVTSLDRGAATVGGIIGLAADSNRVMSDYGTTQTAFSAANLTHANNNMADIAKISMAESSNLATNSSRQMGELSAFSMGSMSALSESALYNTASLAGTALSAQSNLAGQALRSQADIQLTSLGMLANLAERSVATVSESTKGALAFAGAATRSEGSMNTETLIKWGSGVVGAIAAAWLLKGLRL